MTHQNAHQTVGVLHEWLHREGYSESYVHRFKTTTKQLLKFMDSSGISVFNTEVGLRFLHNRYNYDPSTENDRNNSARMRTMQMLSEFQLHGAPLPKAKSRSYVIPPAYKTEAEEFLAYRRFEGIIERNMSTVSLYLERFFTYLTGQEIKKISEISIHHIHGFLRFLSGFSASTKDHTMRTVRQFMGFCFRNGYCPEDLSADIPGVHYEKRSRIPSAYSYNDVMKVLELIDRSNPIGKRDYAVFIPFGKARADKGIDSRLDFSP